MIARQGFVGVGARADKKGCRSEWDDPAAADQGRRLVIEWTVSL
jgi:hypothetical protein